MRPIVAATALAIAGAAVAVERPLWEAGAGVLAASYEAWPGADERRGLGLAYPWFVYHGEVLRVQDGSVTARLIDRRRLVIDASLDASPSVRPRDDGARAGMPELGWLLEAGPRVRWRLDDPADRDERWFASLAARAAISVGGAADDGVRPRGGVVSPSLDYLNRKLAAGRLTVQASVAPEFATARYADHLLGVPPGYATAARPAYVARGGYAGTRLYGWAQYRIDDTFSVFGFVDAGLYAGSTNRDSPLHARSVSASAGLGMTIALGRSSRRVTLPD